MQRIQMVARTIGIVVTVGVLGPGGLLEAADATTAGSRPLATAIEGVWEPTVTILDCASGAVLVSFLSMDTYIRDGSYVGVGAPEPHTPGFGRWQHISGREFTARYQFFTYRPGRHSEWTPPGLSQDHARCGWQLVHCHGQSRNARSRWQLDISVCCLWNPRGEEALLARLAVADGEVRRRRAVSPWRSPRPTGSLSGTRRTRSPVSRRTGSAYPSRRGREPRRREPARKKRPPGDPVRRTCPHRCLRSRDPSPWRPRA